MKTNLTTLFVQALISRSKELLPSRRQLLHHTSVLFNKKRPDNWGSKKHRILASSFVKTMADRGDKAALELEPLRKSVKEQGIFHKTLSR